MPKTQWPAVSRCELRAKKRAQPRKKKGTWGTWGTWGHAWFQTVADTGSRRRCELAIPNIRQGNDRQTPPEKSGKFATTMPGANFSRRDSKRPSPPSNARRVLAGRSGPALDYPTVPLGVGQQSSSANLDVPKGRVAKTVAQKPSEIGVRKSLILRCVQTQFLVAQMVRPVQFLDFPAFLH